MPAILKAVLVATVVVAASYDIRYRRIPNWLNLSGLILGFGLNALLFAGHGFALAVLGLLCAAAVYLPLYLLRGMGAGDVKLMAAVGAMAGPQNWFGIFLVTALVGGVVSLMLVVWKKRLRETFFNVAVLLSELAHRRVPSLNHEQLDVRNSKALRMPHGAVIAAGVIGFLVFTSAFRVNGTAPFIR